MSDALLDAFLAGTLDPSRFSHADHVRLTYLLLLERPLPETMIALRDGLARLTTAAGAPEKYHETITFAFAALVNERMSASTAVSWEAFAAENPDLLTWGEGSVLDRLYTGGALSDPEAKRTFLLPRARVP